MLGIPAPLALTFSGRSAHLLRERRPSRVLTGGSRGTTDHRPLILPRLLRFNLASHGQGPSGRARQRYAFEDRLEKVVTGILLDGGPGPAALTLVVTGFVPSS